ncbi:hypothetical protein [Hyunsoonleella ulvae]|uniref:hypothetical protein n=1 Tax=Hyunsoonleella ulvae TaxID=2799948 RepID=UPI00193A94CB|nr:hypothetical protein [Hyunsoonleella ulvae]
MKRKLITVFTVLLIGGLGISQEHEATSHKEDTNQRDKKHRIAFVLAHSYISLENNEILSIPTFGLDYEYWLSKRWGVGVFSDIELISKEVSPAVDGMNIERECPLVVTLDVLWNPVEHWEFVVGPGLISERGDVQSLVRMGVEYDLELSHHWDVAPNLFYDQKFDGNYAISIGIGIAKSF